MTLTAARAGRHLISACLLSTVAIFAIAPRASAQDQPPESKSMGVKSHGPCDPCEYRTFYLANATQPSANDLITDLRNMLPGAKIYRVDSQGAVSILGSAEELQLAQHILTDLDHPAKTYRLTFTFSGGDANAAADSRRITMVAVVGNKSEVKQGSKIPIVTGSFDDQSSKSNTQVQYEDVGLNIDAWLDSSGDGLRLRTKIEQSSVADEKSNVGIQDPVLRQTFLDGQSTLVEGKPMLLGKLDLPGSSRSEEVEVVAEAVK